MRECECGCGERYHDPTGRNRFFNEACRKRAKRREVKRAKMSGLKAAVRSGGPPPIPDPPPPPPTYPTDDYQSHAAERADLMTAAICYARQAINDGFEVTILRDGECAVLRMRPDQEARSVVYAAMTRKEGPLEDAYRKTVDCVGASIEQRRVPNLDEFVASRMGGGR